jgi:hypothetical protein
LRLFREMYGSNPIVYAQIIKDLQMTHSNWIPGLSSCCVSDITEARCLGSYMCWWLSFFY